MRKTSKKLLTAAILAVISMGFAGGGALAKTLEIELPGPGAFTTDIDNQYWPLPVGAHICLHGRN